MKKSNIAFIGCLAGEVDNVEQFILERSSFMSLDDSQGSGLIVIDYYSKNIIFIFNRVTVE